MRLRQQDLGEPTAPARGALLGRETALFLDIDGTIADIAPTPFEAKVPVEVSSALERLHAKLNGAVVILTGRTAVDADAMLAPVTLPLAAVHGAQVRLPGSRIVEARAAALSLEFVGLVRDLCAPLEGVFVEHKISALTVHYRLAPGFRDQLYAALQCLLATFPMLALVEGRMCLEIHDRRRSKSEAVSFLMSLKELAGRRPIVVGDDAADAAAFTTATSLGGCGLAVAGEYFSAGDAAFSGPEAVRRWLRDQASL